ncbi:MAG: MFS transporter [Planctomycetales bacterium]|nr:MFS transporter [Planctomycetales bacterium]
MHGFDDVPSSLPATGDSGPWYKELNRYHWFVLLVSVLGWLFDTMDQQLFNLARGPAINELRGTSADFQFYGGLATMVFMLGWATGGMVFGVLGDRVGRAKTMMMTILLYSLFTGLSALSVTYWDFVFYRFLTGLGVGGEFAVGVALVAEVMPERARPHALGWLQACSAIGNITAAFISMGLAPLESAGMLGEWKPWRFMFVVGALPAFLALLIRRRLQEPEKWTAMRASKTHKLGSISELFGHPVYRRNAIVGLILATSGVVGLWGIGFFSFDLVRSVFRQTFEEEARVAGTDSLDREFVRTVLHQPELLDTAVTKIRAANAMIQPDARALYGAALSLRDTKQAVTIDAVLAGLDKKGQTAADKQRRTTFLGEPTSASKESIPNFDEIAKRSKEMDGRLTLWAGINGLLFNIGAFFGIYSFAKITHRIGRRPAFAITFVLAMFATAFTFWNLKHFNDIFWMVPMMGFCQIALFGGYAIYFPELFPTRLRSTGVSFCYNVGRYLAAPGPLLLGTLASLVFGSHGEVLSWRYAGVTMCSFFVLGMLVLPFAPETKGKPLPE